MVSGSVLVQACWASVVVFGVTALGGCGQYVDRRDTVAFSTGEAVNQNALAHLIDPWPIDAANRNIPLSGERGARVIRRYQNPPQPSGGPSTVINVGR
jgi:hypothetical protein